jgi:hypothetical protein
VHAVEAVVEHRADGIEQPGLGGRRGQVQLPGHRMRPEPRLHPDRWQRRSHRFDEPAGPGPQRRIQ